ncbi:MAG: amidohydrolase [Chloroflexi bacterium]|nr:amidohydrolase [Chloroflexota bacterium]
MIFDFHTHIFPPWVVAERDSYLRREAGFASLYSSPKAKLATAADLLASMDRVGIDVSVALSFPWKDPELVRRANDYLMEAVARQPQRLVGFGMVNPSEREVAVREAERCAAGGLRGLGEMRPDDQGFDLGDQALLASLAQVARERGLILLTHVSEPVGHLYAGKGRVTLEGVWCFITAFPQNPVVLAHWGGGLPFYALMPEVEAALKNVYFDTAASPYLYRPQVFPRVAELVGADKILHGSDYPLLGQQRLLRDIRGLRLAPQVEAQILGGNAQRLLGWS